MIEDHEPRRKRARGPPPRGRCSKTLGRIRIRLTGADAIPRRTPFWALLVALTETAQTCRSAPGSLPGPEDGGLLSKGLRAIDRMDGAERPRPRGASLAAPEGRWAERDALLADTIDPELP